MNASAALVRLPRLRRLRFGRVFFSSTGFALTSLYLFSRPARLPPRPTIPMILVLASTRAKTSTAVTPASVIRITVSPSTIGTIHPPLEDAVEPEDARRQIDAVGLELLHELRADTGGPETPD